MRLLTILAIGLIAQTVVAAPNNYKTNCCAVENAPEWLSSYTLQDIATDMEREMGGWTIKRVTVKFHNTPASFSNASRLNFSALAFFSPSAQTIEFSPQKDIESFTKTFRHELSHAISNQKFKGAIPAWLEEGFANYLGSKHKVDYKWLSSQPLPNASHLAHPSTDASGSRMHYSLSTATVEMIAKRCNLQELLMLATGAKLTSYLETFCKIKDIDTSVREWVQSKK